MTSFARGESILFSASFSEADGDPATPSSVTLSVAYQHNGRRVQDSLPMTLSSGTWTATWSSSAAEPGPAWYRIVSSGPAAVAQGAFELASNPAD